jgi:hypothetical protein
VGDVDRHVRPGLVAPTPEREAPIVVLQRAQALHVALHRLLQLLRPGQAGGRERGEHVAQRGHGQDARRQLLGALERVGGEVEHRVGEGLERGRRGRDLEAAD